MKNRPSATVANDPLAVPGAQLVLGTAQFGMAYGATNTRGRISLVEVDDILDRAVQNGIMLVDTAPAYGESEEVVGAYLRRNPQLGVVTKTLHFSGSRITAAEIAALRSNVDLSQTRLGRSSLDAVLVHHGRDLCKPGGDAIWSALVNLQAQGKIKRIGVSIYDRDELEAILDRFNPSIVQVPLNVLDQRLDASGMLDTLRTRHVEIHARSVFLQGVLLAQQERAGHHFQRHAAVLSRYRQFLGDTGMSALAACLGYAMRVAAADRIVVGVSSLDELDEVLAALRKIPAQLPDFAGLACADPDLIDPRRWPAVTV